jgi:hypothetical protein
LWQNSFSFLLATLEPVVKINRGAAIELSKRNPDEYDLENLPTAACWNYMAGMGARSAKRGYSSLSYADGNGGWSEIQILNESICSTSKAQCFFL